MNILEKIQEQYIQEFNDNIPLDEFVLNVLVVAILVSILRLFYIHFGSALSNRRRFAHNFLPLALGTMLIITIVKSSIALSLGLVGALSIVRYRAAIKDPEELTYLFIVIGVGLAGGANQPILAIVALVFILLLLYIHNLLTSKAIFRKEDRLYVNISSDIQDLGKITDLVTSSFSFVELKRMDALDKGLECSFICKSDSLKQLDDFRQKVQGLSPATRLSIIDQPDLSV